MKAGKVYLIGAGPGDVELLTLKAVRALEISDMVLLDDLVDREVLRFTRMNAQIIPVGKRGGCKSTPQTFIQRQMITYARKGKTVARLKGGDPFVFGRGGEELEVLRAASIEVEIVPGLTSGIAAPGILNIPVTHRDYCGGVTLVTGHGRDVNWQALAHSGTTLVIYMGLKNIHAITRALICTGMNSATPAAAIQNATCADQREVVSTLAHLPQDVESADLKSPAIIVIGEVVSLTTHRQDILQRAAS
ncbi:MAG TPA: uroporphyrinogen-III C-methyltransferase [Gammaproteobacteria bacterium]|nr:uroporphyrinogen-III C-methyltransferase [Gammaproteobacteria bacterium]